MALFGGITTTTTVGEGMQFGVLVPWINQWIVCCNGNTVLVLEPQNLKCVGAMTLGQRIVDFCTHKRHLYMLVVGHQRTIVKLSLPLSLPEPEQSPVVVNIIEPPSVTVEEDTMAPSNMADTVKKDGLEHKQKMVEDDNTGTVKEERLLSNEVVPIIIRVEEEETDSNECVKDGVDVPHVDEQSKAAQVTTEDLPIESKNNAKTDKEEEKELSRSDEGTSSSVGVAEDEKKEETTGAKKVLSAVESRLHQVADLKGILSNPLGKLTRNESPKEEEKPKDEPVSKIIVDNHNPLKF